MYTIKIYNANGEERCCAALLDDIELSEDRVHKGNRYYYKGIGVKYRSHFVNSESVDLRRYNVLPHKSTDSFYLGHNVSKICFKNKTGIFEEPYQPQFDDFIGACGSRELSIIENSMLFEKSSVEVIKMNELPFPKQYYFILDYKCGRIKYSETSNPHYLLDLLSYMINNHWNFMWDKDTITDISQNGLVTDVADLFVSRDLDNKLGTVYSVLYSLRVRYPDAFLALLNAINRQYVDSRDIINASIDILKINSVDTNPLDKPYQDIILDNLITGRNCGHCVLEGEGERIKQQYIKNVKEQFRRN